MKRVSMLVSLTVGLIASSGVASAQQTEGPFILGNIDSTCSTSGPGPGNWTITCGDIAPGSGTTLITPPSVDSVLAPVDVAPAPAPASEPAAEPAAVDDPATDVPADVVAETAVRTPTPMVMASAMTTRSPSMPRTPGSGTPMGTACPMARSS